MPSRSLEEARWVHVSDRERRQTRRCPGAAAHNICIPTICEHQVICFGPVGVVTGEEDHTAITRFVEPPLCLLSIYCDDRLIDCGNRTSRPPQEKQKSVKPPLVADGLRLAGS